MNRLHVHHHSSVSRSLVIAVVTVELVKNEMNCIDVIPN